jgi:hypothetical protein
VFGICTTGGKGPNHFIPGLWKLGEDVLAVGGRCTRQSKDACIL